MRVASSYRLLFQMRARASESRVTVVIAPLSRVEGKWVRSMRVSCITVEPELLILGTKAREKQLVD